ncbi:NAD(P)H-dependent flavin oxidoreductase [Bacillus kwashiorkori]|uniref:NAD(P)H-dependent flavin oxidoreductase n=1 Tax=Bacillus kwashiorkori TaxID=1522318 RepID=UPI000781A118|nr:nitronate monooxygenase [Bacillus kwashiorkori]
MNRLCKILNIRFPIIQGGMGNISNAPLTAAISEAGALGTFGVGTRTPEEVEPILQQIKRTTTKPFAVNIPISVTKYGKEWIDLVSKYSVPVVSLSAGNPANFIPYLKERGIKVMTVVGTVKHGLKAMEAGTDIVVGEGFEAAGINSPYEITTMALIPQLRNSLSIPIIAAGGIGDGRGLAAALTLGADGVQLGTRFIVAKEAPFSKRYKEKIIQANDQATVIVGRSVGKIRRLLHTPYAQQLLTEEQNGMDEETYFRKTTELVHWRGAMEGDVENGLMNSGQIAGLVYAEQTAEEIIDSLIQEAKQAITELYKSYIV